jgi:hypothetical protein
MRLNLNLPVVKPGEFEKPRKCTNPKCKGKRFHPFQVVKKQIRDSKYDEVQVIRYRCLRCGCTFRVYPEGVSKKQTSKRVGGMAIMLYILGLSYTQCACGAGPQRSCWKHWELRCRVEERVTCLTGAMRPTPPGGV